MIVSVVIELDVKSKDKKFFSDNRFPTTYYIDYKYLESIQYMVVRA